MTDRMSLHEYVELFRKEAEAYLAALAAGEVHLGSDAERRWTEKKLYMGAHDAIALCDAWLAEAAAAAGGV